MLLVYTNGRNDDFIKLCSELDHFLNEIVGGEKQRENYIQYNTLEEIDDVVLAINNDKAIGCASFKEYSSGAVELKRVFLKEEYRGSGIIKDMIKVLEVKAKEKGYNKIILETGKPLIAARKFYEKVGYEIIDNYEPYTNMPLSICMEKNI